MAHQPGSGIPAKPTLRATLGRHYVIRQGRSLQVVSVEPNNLVPADALEIYGTEEEAEHRKREMVQFGLDIMRLVFNGGYFSLDRHEKKDMKDWFGMDFWNEA